MTPQIHPPGAMPARIGRNPLFILSAGFMLAGCFLVSHAVDPSPGAIGPLLGLIAVLQVYECALIGVAAWLIRRAGRTADGRLLLILELPFLFDAAHLNTEMALADPSIGAAINAVLFALLIAKLAAILLTLGLTVPVATRARFVSACGLLFATPIWLSAISHPQNRVHPEHLYIAWWVAGLAIMLAADKRLFDGAGPDRRFTTITGVTAVLAVVVHTVTTGWVYRVEPTPWLVAPALLGVALAVRPMLREHLVPATITTLETVIPALAVLLSLTCPRDYAAGVHVPFPATELIISPLRVVLFATAATYVALALRPWRPLMLSPACASFILMTLGHSVASIADTIDRIAARVRDALAHLLPDTPLGWGIVCLVAAFLLLIGGTVFSMRRRPHEPAASNQSESASTEG